MDRQTDRQTVGQTKLLYQSRVSVAGTVLPLRQLSLVQLDNILITRSFQSQETRHYTQDSYSKN